MFYAQELAFCKRPRWRILGWYHRPWMFRISEHIIVNMTDKVTTIETFSRQHCWWPSTARTTSVPAWKPGQYNAFHKWHCYIAPFVSQFHEIYCQYSYNWEASIVSDKRLVSLRNTLSSDPMLAQFPDAYVRHWASLNWREKVWMLIAINVSWLMH